MQVDSFLTCTMLYLDNCYFKKDFFILIIILTFLLWFVYNFLYTVYNANPIIMILQKGG